MPSATSRGNYYKRKSKDWYEKQGYTVQLTEFTCGMIIQGKCVYRKIDIFGSDGIAMNENEIIFWNSKAASSHKQLIDLKSKGKMEFQKYPFPKCVRRQAIIWEIRKPPTIVEY